MFKIVQRLAGPWRQLNGRAAVMTLQLAGAQFGEGILVEHAARSVKVPMAA